ncbi:hypothetical protein [Cellulomonas aerilata]|uniref:Uncharacterized protein n=1 Tax=Cellulomonas aerilata TaxID=515326 RepID=A0A512D9I9_9CELL|nr:hypothetical protein [Cellulomonas aerilata]GEO33164.1 hypothetical protein CAE01nite_08890 [Cellulomonas aerilata]
MDAAAQTLLVGAAVSAVALLIYRGGALAGVGWVVALAAAGFTLAALWAALSGDDEPGTVPSTGWWLTTFALANSLAVTSPDLWVRTVVVLALLGILGLRLTAAAHPVGAGHEPGGEPDLRHAA